MSTTQKNICETLIGVARMHETKASMVSSAVFCREEAERALTRQSPEEVRLWAAESLKYSVGILSPIYQAVAH